MELQGTLRNSDSHYVKLSMHLDGNSDKRMAFFSNKGGKLVDFVEYSRYFQDLLYPSQGTQVKVPKPCLLKRQRKFELFNPSQAMLEKLSVRSSLRSSTGKVQQCSLTQ